MTFGLKASADGTQAIIQVGGIDRAIIDSTGKIIASKFSGDGSELTGVIKSGTAINTTSGTSHDFTGIPAGVKRVTVVFNGVSTNGASPWLVRLGGSGGVESTGYLGGAQYATGGYPGAVGVLAYTSGLGCVSVPTAASLIFGQVTIENITGNEWVLSGNLSDEVGRGHKSNCNKTLSTVLDRVRLTTVTGTDVFDAGSVNILWE